MVKERIIQNYYEIHGNFNGINNTPLVNMLGSNKDNKTSFYYSILGYKPLEIKNKKDKRVLNEIDCHNLRVLYLRGDLQGLYKNYQIESMSDLKELLESVDLCPREFKTINYPLSKEQHECMNALVLYLKNCNKLIKWNNNVSPVSNIITALKAEPKHLKVVADEIMPQLEIKFATTTKPLHVLKDTVFYKKEFTREAQERIIRYAIYSAIKGADNEVLKLFKKAPELLWLPITDNKLYLDILDYAEANNYTYRELLNSIDIAVPDYYECYKYTGFIFTSFMDTFSILDDRFDENNIKITMDKSQLLAFISLSMLEE